MTPALPVRRVALAVLALGLLTPASADAFAHGYRCRLGQYWRPSLGICQNHPYDGQRSSQSFVALDRFEAATGQSNHPLVTTDTRIVPYRRSMSRGHLVVRYLVQTQVVERY